MSIKRRYEAVTHTVTEEICIEETTCCDICGKEIDTDYGYWQLTTGHNDWGNDSCDSIERFDICSRMCLMNKFAEYLDESGADDCNTKYFEVRRV